MGSFIGESLEEFLEEDSFVHEEGRSPWRGSDD